MNAQEIYNESQYIIPLVIGYVLLLAFIVTVILTFVSLVRPETIPEKYRSKLFSVLILQLVVVCVAFFADFIKIDYSKVKTEIELANPLLQALEDNDLSVLKKIVDSGANINAALNKNNEAPIHIAIRNSMNNPDATTIMYLVNKGATVDKKARIALVNRCKNVGVPDGTGAVRCCDHAKKGEAGC